MRASHISADGKYRGYKSGDGYELWLGKKSEDPEVGVLVGYYVRDFDLAVDNAEEEARCLMADAVAEFGLEVEKPRRTRPKRRGFSEEEQFEMMANFAPGETVVNIVTGNTWTVPR